MQNKPNFMRFSPENDDLTKNKANSNPIQTQFPERPKLMQSMYIQKIRKKNANMGPKKQSQNKPNLFNTMFRLLYTLRGLFWGICVCLNALLIGDWTDLIRN